MEQSEITYTVEFSESKEREIISLEDLEKRILEFLELYGEEPVVGKELRSIIGEGDGEVRFARLLEAVHYKNDTRGFFIQVLKQLEKANGNAAVTISINGVTLPYRLLLVFLEHIIPGEQVFSIKGVRRLEKLTNVKIPKAHQEKMQRVLDLYPVRLSTHTIRQMRLSPAVSYQYMPYVEELDKEGLFHTWVGQFHRGVLEQMYRNRVIFILNMSCPVYCRFCFRKHKECRNQRAPTQKHVTLALAYIKSCPEIKEVVLTGGDPFMNRPTVTWAIDGLRDIPHIETLRIASRAVSYQPSLFTTQDNLWLNYLKRKQLELKQKNKRLEVATHFVHPDEISVQTLELISELVSSGIPVYIQTPFLGGCNTSGDELVELFRQLRSVGAEIHYVFMPCSPLQGCGRYRSTIGEGIRAAAYLRAHLSDRAIPHFTTATAIGKIDWGSSGWVVETDSVDDQFIWIRTPYTQEYFETFAPLLNLGYVARPNSEGTLDAKFMAGVGNDSLLLGPRETSVFSRAYLERERFPEAIALESLQRLQIQAKADQTGPPPIIDSRNPFLRRVHKTRVDINCEIPEENIPNLVKQISQDEYISDAVLYSSKDIVHSLYRAGKLIEQLKQISHISVIRLRSWAFNYDPQAFSDTVIKRITSWNSLNVTFPTRIELETQFLHPTEFNPLHEKISKAFLQRGVAVYNNTPLLAFINDSKEDVTQMTSKCRQAGIEVTHLYVGGMPLQNQWSKEHPIHVSQLIDISSHLRRSGSGRELPRYIVRTSLGDADLGLNALVVGSEEDGTAQLKLLPYNLDYFKSIEPSFTWPEGVRQDEDGHPIVTVNGLLM